MSEGRNELLDPRAAHVAFLAARRARRLRNGVIAGVLALGCAAAAFSGPRTPVVWADEGEGFFGTSGEQLMRERLQSDRRDDDARRSAEELRATSEARLEAHFEAEQAGLWSENCGDDLKGEDYQACMAQAEPEAAEDHVEADPIAVDPAVKRAVAAVPVVLGSGVLVEAVRGTGDVVSPAATGRSPEPIGGGGADIGVPIGAIGGGVAGQVFPIQPTGPGMGTIPDDPSNPPGDGDDDGNTPPPSAPEGEVPIPAPFLLFPAGVAILRWMKR